MPAAPDEDPAFEINFEDIERVTITIPESEARALNTTIKDAVAKASDGIEIIAGSFALVRITLDQQQMKRLIDNLEYKLRRARLREVP